MAISSKFHLEKNTWSIIYHFSLFFHLDILGLLIKFFFEYQEHLGHKDEIQHSLYPQNILFCLNILLNYILFLLFELSPAIKLLDRKLSLNQVNFFFESLNLINIVSPCIVPVKQLDIPDFVNFTRKLNILLDVVDFLVLQ